MDTSVTKIVNLRQLPSELKLFVGLFLVVLSIGFFTGINFVHLTTEGTAQGIEENYLGNETNDAAELMKFKKSENQLLNIIHTHILSLSVIFFILGGLVYLTSLKQKIKKFLMYEGLLSVLTTFGSMYFLWTGMLWMKYILITSGLLMTLNFVVSVLLVFVNLIPRFNPDSMISKM